MTKYITIREILPLLIALISPTDGGSSFSALNISPHSTPPVLSPPLPYLTSTTLTPYSAADVEVQKLFVDEVAVPPSLNADPANVLILHPIYAGSHEVVLRGLAVEMVRRGHKVTQLRWKSDHHPIDINRRGEGRNATDVGWREGRNTTNGGWGKVPTNDTVGGGRDKVGVTERSHVDILTVSVQNKDNRYPYISPDGSLQPPTKLLWDTERSIFNLPTDVFRLIDAQCSTLLGDASLIQALNSSSFSVAVVDIISNECSLALAHILNIPVVGYWGFPFQGGEARRMGMHQSPAIVPMMMSELSAEMSFLERLGNTVLHLIDELLMTYQTSVTDGWIQKFHPDVPSSSNLLHHVDAMLVSVDWSLDYPKLIPSHVHYIGCLLCRPGKTLDSELEQFMRGAGNAGVVVFSFGLTGFDSNVVPKDFRYGALEALSQLEQRVVLHFDPQKLDFIPSNVLARKLLPQQDLLAHSQSKVFVSHCGMNSVNEALYHGKPLVCVPNFADQGDIAKRVLDKEYGVTVSKKDMSRDVLKGAILEVLNNKKYSRNVRRVASLWSTQESGLDLAIGWVERVSSHGPFPHLRFPGADLNIFQLLCLDVLLVIVMSIFSFALIAYVMLRKVFTVMVTNLVLKRVKLKKS